MHCMVNNVRHFNYSAILAQHLQNGHTIRAVSDGSYNPEFKLGTAAWVIKHYDDENALIGDNLVPGCESVQCSHRSELTGMIRVVRHMNLLCRRYNV